MNVRKIETGREIRTVEIDLERAPLVVWAFKTYATGEWTTRTLHAEVTRRGLTTKATLKRAEGPIALSAFGAMLKNPYYIGVVRYRGVDYEGKHEHLIDKTTFDLVQQQLEAHNYAGEKQRQHHHYLKGSVFCGKPDSHGNECGCRLIVSNATSRSKEIYPYFICIGRQRDTTSCKQRALMIEDVEEAICDYYAHVELGQDLRLQTEQQLLEEITKLRENTGVDRQQLIGRQRRALTERGKLLEAHYAGALPLDLLKSEQERLARELGYLEERLSALEISADVVERNLRRALAHTANLHGAYIAADRQTRRLINQAMFERFTISDDGEIVGELKAPFRLLFQATGAADEDGTVRTGGKEKPRASQKARGLSKHDLVELGGLEPPTSWVRRLGSGDMRYDERWGIGSV